MTDSSPRALRSGLQTLLHELEPAPSPHAEEEPPLPAPLPPELQNGHPEWLVRDGWRLLVQVRDRTVPRSAKEIARFERFDGTQVSVWFDETQRLVYAPFRLEEAYENYVSEAWRHAVERRVLSPRQLDLFYRLKRFIPRSVQLAARRAFIRTQGMPEFPAWPLDSSVVSLLRFFVWCRAWTTGRSTLRFLWFWPNSFQAAFVLTHDVESARGLRLAIEIADLEEEHGFRSSFNIGAWYDHDPGILRELNGRGFEIGLHGIRHDRTMFASRASFDQHRRLLGQLADSLGAVGFRSPSTYHRFPWLAELPVEYDCSIPHSDPFEPQPGGCCTIWPFFIGSVVEVPYTLPQDHTLFTLLQQRSVDLWLDEAQRLEELGGLIHCVSHPDPGYLGDPAKRALYVEFLRAMAERSRLWRALPRDIAAWWRARADSAAVERPVTLGLAEAGETRDETVFRPAQPEDDARLAAESATSLDEQIHL